MESEKRKFNVKMDIQWRIKSIELINFNEATLHNAVAILVYKLKQ